MKVRLSEDDSASAFDEKPSEVSNGLKLAAEGKKTKKIPRASGV